MKKFLMIASAAAMAVTMPAMAKPDKGNGGGNNAAHQGGGKGKPDKARGNEFKAQKASNNGFKQATKQAEKAQKQQFKAAEKSVKNRNKAVERAVKAENKQAERFAKQREKASERYAKAQEKATDRRFEDGGFQNRERFERAGLNGDGRFCPPGLAKKNNGCMPPGQARKSLAVGQQFQSSWYPNYNLPQDYRDVYSDNSQYYYRYDNDGYIYRVNRDSDLVSGLIPLLGGGFGVGQVMPAGYNLYNVPFQYRDSYYDTDDSHYRYGDNAIYQVDPQTQMIESVVALLTGDSFGVGQTLPAGYDMYNLPMQYRDQYYDDDQYNYRYADGNIYQVDPKTQIIQAIISALV